MTTLLNEAAASLTGAWRLAHFDAGGMGYFNTTREGVWRSFWAAAIVAPLYALLLSAAFPLLDPAPNGLRFILVEAEGYVLSWVAYPLVIAWLTQQIGCWKRFPAYLVAYNWAMVLANGVTIPINIARITEIVPADAGGFLWLVGVSAVFAYLWFIARTALAVSVMAATGIVFLDLALSLLIGMTTTRMYWPVS